MKIRTDFVTNSSSSSFVSYKLHDSDFCRYVYEQMQKKGLSYCAYPALVGYVELNENNLSAEIGVTAANAGGDPEEGLYCDNYAPECWNWNGYFNMSIGSIESCLADSAKETFRQILEEELKKTSFKELLDAKDWDDSYTWSKYGGYYRGKEISDSENFHLCSRLFALLSDCKYDEDYRDHIKKQNDMIHIMSNPDDEEESFIDLFPDHLYVVAFDGYSDLEREEDIIEMSSTDTFISIISCFIPLYDAAEDDEEKLYELFKKDRENGKFSCDVYMGSTD